MPEQHVYAKLARLTDVEAGECLNGLLKGLAVQKHEFEVLFASPDVLAQAAQKAAGELRKEGAQVDALLESSSPRAVRGILVELASDPNQAVAIENWLETKRDKLIEPVTATLVAAGIVFLLQSHFKVKFEQEGGKRTLRVEFEKKPTSEGLLRRVLGLGR